MADYKAIWRVRTRAWAVDLLGGCCSSCGDIDGLDFDHIDPATKAFDISAGIRDGYGRERLQAELRKCQLLCRRCHSEKTLAHRQVPHGGGAAGRRRCKCGPCKTRKAEYMKQYMKGRRKSTRI